MGILEKFSYLCDVEVLINKELIEQPEQILISFNDMNTNKINPKPFYNNNKKKNINNLLNSLAILLTNAITLEKYERFFIKKQILFII